MRAIVDLRYAAPSSINLAPRVRGVPQAPPPPNVVLMEYVRGRFVVGGIPFDDADAAMGYADARAKNEGRRVFIVGFK